ncbi:MAG: hypothetical protein EOM22_11160 [Gammaproteobacteria bacterium]|nr:hypothetical protein [Gammaproteobacteria bacterium]
MNELSPSVSGSVSGEAFQNCASMTSREIAKLTGKQHKHVLRDIDAILATLSPELGLGFKTSTYRDATGKSNRQFEMDRDSSYCVVAGYDANARMRIVKRWQELEAKALKPALPDFTNPAEAARAWASEYEHKQAALAQLEAAQPAIEFHARVGDSGSLHSIDEVAKALHAPPMKFRKLLKTDICLFRKDGLPKQDFINRGYVRVVEKILPHTGRPYPQTFFTGKGFEWVQRKIDHTLLGAEV